MASFLDIVTQGIDLNVARPNNTKLYTVRGDTTSRQIKANIYNGSRPVELVDSGDASLRFNTAYIIYQLPDGSPGYYEYTDYYVTDVTQPTPNVNTIWFSFAPEVTAMAGTVKIWVLFERSQSGSGSLDFLRTYPFDLVVADCPYINPTDPDYDPLNTGVNP